MSQIDRQAWGRRWRSRPELRPVTLCTDAYWDHLTRTEAEDAIVGQTIRHMAERGNVVSVDFDGETSLYLVWISSLGDRRKFYDSTLEAALGRAVDALLEATK